MAQWIHREALGSLIKQVREELGLSQERYAHELGITRNTYAEYESGSVVPKAGMMIKIFGEENVPTHPWFLACAEREIVVEPPAESRA